MKAKFFFLVVALQALWVVATITIQEVRLHQGTVVLLETRPVDPRDYLRGDYVILNYKISSLPASLFSGGLPSKVPDGTAVYVRLVKRGEFYEAESASLTELSPDAQHPVLRGKTRRSWSNNVNIEYGLERFYVREGTGNPTGKLTVDAAVPTSGQAVIKQVYVDGKPYAEVMKEKKH